MFGAAACGVWLVLSATAHAATSPSGKKQVCVYSQNETEMVPTFASLVGRTTVDCAMVYVNSPTWSTWDSPWFVHYVDPNYNWAEWVQDSPANDPRQLIVNTTLIPSGVSSDPNWRAEGAAGDFTSYDQTFAQTLVSDGLANAIIVLGAEANGNWEYDNIGSTAAQVSDWVQTWRNTVIAMRSVPGADFKFVWDVNNRIPATPFASYYPGDDVVDIIGDDAYDSAVTDDANDWSEVAGSADGVNSLVAFAQAHGKPIAFPEWGVGVRDSGNLAGNDDPSYVNGMAGVIAADDVAFECYFFNDEWETELEQGPLSLAAYKAAFGDGGWALGDDDGENVTPTPAYTQTPVTVNGSQTGTTTAPAPAQPGPTTTTASATTTTVASTTTTVAGTTTTARTPSTPARSQKKSSRPKRRRAKRRMRSRRISHAVNRGRGHRRGRSRRRPRRRGR